LLSTNKVKEIKMKEKLGTQMGRGTKDFRKEEEVKNKEGKRS
jgi:hypothetical protein